MRLHSDHPEARRGSRAISLSPVRANRPDTPAGADHAAARRVSPRPVANLSHTPAARRWHDL